MHVEEDDNSMLPKQEFDEMIALMSKWPNEAADTETDIMVKGAKELVGNTVLLKAAQHMLLDHPLAMALRPLVRMVIRSVDLRLASAST